MRLVIIMQETKTIEKLKELVKISKFDRPTEKDMLDAVRILEGD